jgi:hypothetical protein
MRNLSDQVAEVMDFSGDPPATCSSDARYDFAPRPDPAHWHRRLHGNEMGNSCNHKGWRLLLETHYMQSTIAACDL